MTRIRIDARAFLRDFAQLEADILASAKQSLGQAAAYARELAMRTSSFKDRTGKLRRSIMRGEKSKWSLFVRAGIPGARYAKFVEDGTKPHVIEARNAKVLRFVQNGRVRFAKRVHHPGTKPRHFMLDARNAAEAQLGRFIVSGISRVIH